MKTPKDPRHIKRIYLMQALFAWDFTKKQKPKIGEAAMVTKNLAVIDGEIKKAAKEWPLKQINKVDLAILRLAIFELIIKRDSPFKVIIDEAVELAKKFGSESSPSFVNGVLGNIIATHKLDYE